MTTFSNDPVVSIKDATIFQDNNIVLSSVNLELEKGEFVFLVGRTGGGKSSLLRTLYADLPLRRGDVRVAGFTLGNIKRSKIPLLRRKIGIIFQDFQLLPDRTVAENLNFVMKATGWKESGKIKARQAEVLMQVGLGTAGSRMPHQLSGGEQQRVVIARALINEPVILIADEPTGNLDPDVSQGILALFKQINNQGTAVLMATHDHTLIENNDAGRILKCEKGKLLDSNTGDFQIKTNIY